MNPVELYKYVSGNDAPAQLVEAYEATVKNHTPADRFEKELIGEAQSENTPQMSATTFQNNYCYSGWDYLYCWVNRTGTSYVQNYKFSMHANSSPYRGTIRHRLRYKSWGSWHTVRDFVVLQNQVSYIYSSGTWRTRESKVFEASGDGYHHSIRGTN
ncbi:MAG: hypothetical protein KDD36_08045, partial [Flavobacteriales bacterium]|nr:hypothetical protein [Flavobacteriales bacterium]